MLADLFLNAWRVVSSTSDLIKRLCAGAANATSLFKLGVCSRAFQ